MLYVLCLHINEQRNLSRDFRYAIMAEALILHFANSLYGPSANMLTR